MRYLSIFLVMMIAMPAASQFSFYYFFPVSVSDMFYGDTLLNNRATLLKAGVRKITSVQQHNRNVLFVNHYSIDDGRVASRRFCIMKDGDTTFCNSDSFTYSDEGRLLRFISLDGQGKIFTSATGASGENGLYTLTWISGVPHPELPDTTVYRYWYNEKGQLVRQEHPPTIPMPVNASLFYSADGLLDSVRHDNRNWPTLVFKRQAHQHETEMELETNTTVYRWTYDKNGRWLTASNRSKKKLKLPNKPPVRMFRNTVFSYNDDGTLAKVVEATAGRTVVTTYTYEK